MKKLQRHLGIGTTLLLIFLNGTALADCRKKLADVDKQLAAAELEGVALQQYTMLRNQAETLCSQGQDGTAMLFLGGLEQELPQTDSGATQGTSQGISSAGKQLNDEYLAGTWCAIVTQEQSQITFSKDGTYSACFHDSVQGRFGHCSRPGDTSGWLANFKDASVRGPDEFSLGNSARSTTYRRGDCSQHGI